MVNVQIGYNPYTVKTSILLNGKTIENKVSPLMYVINKRLQEWIEPKGSWPGIFKALRASILTLQRKKKAKMRRRLKNNKRVTYM